MTLVTRYCTEKEEEVYHPLTCVASPQVKTQSKIHSFVFLLLAVAARRVEKGVAEAAKVESHASQIFRGRQILDARKKQQVFPFGELRVIH